ncbi:hypothetical protein [Variovorax sp. Varisp62]|uniref:hypothetical protein n=1 Tax=Variovorax sp. Varisp62 TaxID=3243049 RepID=UPI0039B4D25E
MAFDLLSNTFTLEADLEPFGASLLAAAYYCFMNDEAEWWDIDVIPFESVYYAVVELGKTAAGNDSSCESGEVACWLLLFMREEMRGA